MIFLSGLEDGGSPKQLVTSEQRAALIAAARPRWTRLYARLNRHPDQKKAHQGFVNGLATFDTAMPRKHAAVFKALRAEGLSPRDAFIEAGARVTAAHTLRSIGEGRPVAHRGRARAALRKARREGGLGFISRLRDRVEKEIDDRVVDPVAGAVEDVAGAAGDVACSDAAGYAAIGAGAVWGGARGSAVDGARRGHETRGQVCDEARQLEQDARMERTDGALSQADFDRQVQAWMRANSQRAAEGRLSCAILGDSSSYHRSSNCTPARADWSRRGPGVFLRVGIEQAFRQAIRRGYRVSSTAGRTLRANAYRNLSGWASQNYGRTTYPSKPSANATCAARDGRSGKCVRWCRPIPAPWNTRQTPDGGRYVGVDAWGMICGDRTAEENMLRRAQFRWEADAARRETAALQTRRQQTQKKSIGVVPIVLGVAAAAGLAYAAKEGML